MMLNASNFVYASDSDAKFSTYSNDKKIGINLTNEDQGDLSVLLTDLNGRVLLSETIKSSKTKQRTYDLKNLPDGRYFFEYQDENEVIKETIAIKENRINVISTEKVLAPRVYQTDNRFVLSIIPFGEKTSISLMTESGEVLYTENLIDQESYSKRFDTSKLESGIYTLKIVLGKKAFYEKLYVD